MSFSNSQGRKGLRRRCKNLAMRYRCNAFMPFSPQAPGAGLSERQVGIAPMVFVDDIFKRILQVGEGAKAY
jgi:hypothetical protein